MHILEQLGVALGLASLAGVNLYLTVLITGLAVRFDLLHLASQYQQFEVLGHPVVLIVAGVMFCLEFLADKVPWVDSLWDAVHTFIRPVGGVLLGMKALGDMPVYLEVTAALIAGGAALTTHAAKSGTRLLANHSPEPVSNMVLSVAEDATVVAGTALALLKPVIALGVFATVLIVLWLVFPRIWRGIRATSWLMWNKLKMPGRRDPLAEPVELPRTMSEEFMDVLKYKGNVAAADVVAAVRCLSGKSRGVRGLAPNLDGVLVLTSQGDRVLFMARRGLSIRVFAMELSGARARAVVESLFLSENLLLETTGAGATTRAVFHFPRGQGAVVETIARVVVAPRAEVVAPRAEVASANVRDVNEDDLASRSPCGVEAGAVAAPRAVANARDGNEGDLASRSPCEVVAGAREVNEGDLASRSPCENAASVEGSTLSGLDAVAMAHPG